MTHHHQNQEEYLLVILNLKYDNTNISLPLKMLLSPQYRAAAKIMN
jgi:hypothetical protein